MAYSDDEMFNEQSNDEEMMETNEEDDEVEDGDDEENGGEFDEDDEVDENEDNNEQDDEEADEYQDANEVAEEDGYKDKKKDDDKKNHAEENVSPEAEDTSEKDKAMDLEEASDNNLPSQSENEKDGQKIQEKERQDTQDSNREGTKESPEVEISREAIIDKAKNAKNLDIVPSVAIPYAAQCHTLAFTAGPKWVLTGGDDGFIRKYDFISSIQGKAPLTMAQKHNLVDTVTKAGIISSYWENEQPLTKKEILASNPKLQESDFGSTTAAYEPKVDPVYALDTERNGYWCLSGLSSGGISLYTMRYSEGTLQHYFSAGKKGQEHLLENGHNDAVSMIKLNREQTGFLSGSWDKTIRQWDLNTGKCTNLFLGSSGQISNIQFRPEGLSDLTLSFDSISGASNDSHDNSAIDSLFDGSDNEEDTEEKKGKHDDEKSSRRNSSNATTSKIITNESVFMSSCIDGTINIWDSRASESQMSPVIKLAVTEGTPPWCMSSTWSNCGEFIYAGRRNSTVEEFSLKMPHKKSIKGSKKNTLAPNVLKTLTFPKISGPVSAISTLPNSDYLLCGSVDNIRLYDLSLYDTATNMKALSKKPATPFTIIPGHHGGILSSLYVDETGRFMVSASGNRGWGSSPTTDSILVYEIDFD